MRKQLLTIFCGLIALFASYRIFAELWYLADAQFNPRPGSILEDFAWTKRFYGAMFAFAVVLLLRVVLVSETKKAAMLAWGGCFICLILHWLARFTPLYGYVPGSGPVFCSWAMIFVIVSMIFLVISDLREVLRSYSVRGAVKETKNG